MDAHARLVCEVFEELTHNRMVPLGRKTLFQDLPRFLVAQAGVAFAVGLIAIESGVYFGFLKEAVLPIQESRADLWVAARDTQYFELALPMRYDSVAKAAGVTGVERAEAMLLETAAWRGPEHKLEYLRVIGFDPDGELWSPGAVPKSTLAQLHGTDTAIVDAAKLPGLNIDGIGGSGKIVASVSEVNIGAEQQPIGTRFSERHADAARVHDSRRADHPIKLHVGMAADNDRCVQAFKKRL